MKAMKASVNYPLCHISRLRLVLPVAGVGESGVVFIHGGLADRSVWRNQWVLADTYRIAALDLGGHGTSGSRRKVWSLPTLARDVAAVVKAAGLRGRFHQFSGRGYRRHSGHLPA